MAKYSLEAKFQVWNDAYGDRIEVGDDADGLGLAEIRSVCNDGTRGPSITFPEDAVPLLIEGLQRWLSFRQEQKKPE